MITLLAQPLSGKRRPAFQKYPLPRCLHLGHLGPNSDANASKLMARDAGVDRWLYIFCMIGSDVQIRVAHTAVGHMDENILIPKRPSLHLHRFEVAGLVLTGHHHHVHWLRGGHGVCTHPVAGLLFSWGCSSLCLGMLLQHFARGKLVLWLAPEVQAMKDARQAVDKDRGM